MYKGKLIWVGLFLVFLAFFAVSTLVFAAEDYVTIDVNITETSSIIVVPDTLNWTSTNTGQEGGVKYLTIKNAGSLNVTDINAYVDTLVTESIRPYGSGDPKSYSAGGVLTLRNETDTDFYFAGRIEWNWTQDIPNHDWSNVTSPVAWGYFRNTSYDYVWVLGNGSNGNCNDTDAQFAISDLIDLGTTPTRAPDDNNIGNPDNQDENYGYFSVSRATAPLYHYCVAAYWDCTKIFIYHFDQRTGFNLCVNSEYLQEDDLAPGYTIILEVNPFIPNGIPSGFLNTTTLTVVAT